MMKVSVVVPTYYRAEDLTDLFDSLLGQTVKPFEVIVVDDTADNSIKALCENYITKFENVSSRLTYIKNPGERSATASRNLGIKLAKGEFVAFFDSDVILYPDYMEKVLEVFEKHSNALGVQGWIVNSAKSERNKIFTFYQFFKKCFYLDHSVKDSCKFLEYPAILTKTINCEHLSGANMTFRREVFKEFKFDENLKKYTYMEDVLLSHSIYKKYPKRLFITPHAKLIHKCSISGRMADRALQDHKQKCSKYVLQKLFGLKGLLMYIWQNIGLSILRILKTLKRSVKG